MIINLLPLTLNYVALCISYLLGKGVCLIISIATVIYSKLTFLFYNLTSLIHFFSLCQNFVQIIVVECSSQTVCVAFFSNRFVDFSWLYNFFFFFLCVFQVIRLCPIVNLSLKMPNAPPQSQTRPGLTLCLMNS